MKHRLTQTTGLIRSWGFGTCSLIATMFGLLFYICEATVCLKQPCHQSLPGLITTATKTAEEMLEIVLSIITIKLITSSSLQSCSVSPPGILQGIRTGTNIHNDGVFRSCLSKAIHRAAALSVREHHTAAAQSCSHFHFSSEVTWNLLGQRVGKKHEMWAPWHREIRRYRNGFDVSIRF